MNRFNSIAPVYDWLAQLVFGDAIWKSQIHFLNEIKPSDKVLILGGGSGKILESIPICQSIYFLEKSEKMLQLAKKRNVNQKISWLCEDFLIYHSEEVFDVIICPFFLDAFNEKNLELVINQIRKYLKSSGKLLVIDFQIKKKWHAILVLAMYLFFRIVVSYNGKKLLNFSSLLEKKGFCERKKQSFYSENIFSSVFIHQ